MLFEITDRLEMVQRLALPFLFYVSAEIINLRNVFLLVIVMVLEYSPFICNLF